jgi:hypothetical protein
VESGVASVQEDRADLDGFLAIPERDPAYTIAPNVPEYVPPPFSPLLFEFIGESLEKRTCESDSRSRMDLENVSGGTNRKIPAKPIPVRFCQVHR